ncbi:MAG: PLP-dependent transferase [Candidatus Atribacteria bacterium]|nr:PLP-dependent transferase [Candidatus Atribacteria bacterium]
MKPIDFGVDIVVYSATKFIGGIQSLGVCLQANG